MKCMYAINMLPCLYPQLKRQCNSFRTKTLDINIPDTGKTHPKENLLG